MICPYSLLFSKFQRIPTLQGDSIRIIPQQNIFKSMMIFVLDERRAYALNLGGTTDELSP